VFSSSYFLSQSSIIISLGFYSKTRRAGNETPADLGKRIQTPPLDVPDAQSPSFHASYPSGDLASLMSHLRQEAATRGVELFLADTGDYVDGAGITDATDPKGAALWPLLLSFGEYDLLGVGNHELYIDRTINGIAEGLYAECGNKCVTSNVVWKGTDTGLAARYTVMGGVNSDTRVLGLMFLYNMDDAAGNVDVIGVEDSLRQPWFEEAMAVPDIDAILVTVHIDYRDNLLREVLSAIRTYKTSTPVLFPSGHSHTKGFLRLDDDASSVEAGSNFELEWVSFDKHSAPDRTWFNYEYIRPSVETFVRASGKAAAQFPTSEGEAIKMEIAAIRDELGINEVLGCAAREYSSSYNVSNPGSLWYVYMEEVCPYALFDNSSASPNTPYLIENDGAYRNNMLQGEVTFDDILISSPFSNVYLYFEGLSAREIIAVQSSLGKWASSPRSDPVNGITYDLICTDYQVPRGCAEAVASITGRNFEPKPYREGLNNADLWRIFVAGSWPCSSA
jgi:hypothetical protein